MICSWEDYKAYVKADQSNFVGRGLRGQAFADPICDQYLQRQYLRCLRMAEYAINCHHPLLKLYALWRLRRLGRISGFQIPPNVLGKGVTLFHWGTIIINGEARIGRNATFQPNVVIGKNKKKGGAPQIGDNFYACAGARIFGEITIGHNVRIGPNCCVYKSIPDNCTVVGNPAVIVRKDGIKCKIKL